MAFPIAAAICRRDRERPAFPSESSDDQRSTAMPSVTGHRIWFHGRCAAPSYSCVEIVKISRGYPPLNWIAATCSLSLSLPPHHSYVSLCLRFGLLPRVSPSVWCARTCALFFHVFFSPVDSPRFFLFFCNSVCIGRRRRRLDTLRKAILFGYSSRIYNGWFRDSWKRGDVFVFSLSLFRGIIEVESEFERFHRRVSIVFR